MCVVGKDPRETIYGRVQLRTGTEPKQDHTNMGLVLNEDQPTEVAVVGNQDTSFEIGNGEDFMVGCACRIINGDPRDIVAQWAQTQRDAHVDAFVEEESHTSVGTSSARFLAAANASFRCRERR